MDETYFHLEVHGVNLAEEERISEWFFDYGALGVTQNLKFKQLDAHYTVETLESETIDLDVYFSSLPSPSFVLEIQKTFPSVQVRCHEKKNEDWMEKWKEGFEPFSLVGHYWVIPSWRQAESAEIPTQFKILIDPGMAFGTGTHETTQIAAHLLEKYQDHIKGQDCFDVGTGTAILAILCERLGAKQVKANEIDPVARQVARENRDQNQCLRVDIKDELIDQEMGSFNCVIANIIDGVLLELKEDLIRITRDKGLLFLTGILKEREDIFLKSFLADSQLRVLERTEKSEWVGFVFQKGCL